MGGALGKRLTEGRGIVKGRGEGECFTGVWPRTPRPGSREGDSQVFQRKIQVVRGRAHAVRLEGVASRPEAGPRSRGLPSLSRLLAFTRTPVLFGYFLLRPFPALPWAQGATV